MWSTRFAAKYVAASAKRIRKLNEDDKSAHIELVVERVWDFSFCKIFRVLCIFNGEYTRCLALVMYLYIVYFLLRSPKVVCLEALSIGGPNTVHQLFVYLSMREKLIFCHYIVWLLLYGTLYSLYTHKPNEPNSQTMQSEIQVYTRRGTLCQTFCIRNTNSNYIIISSYRILTCVVIVGQYCLGLELF